MSSIRRSPSRDVQSEAVAHYIRYHLAPENGQSTMEVSIREIMLSMWTSHPALEFAVSSVSAAIFSKVKCQPLAATQASISYQKSLNALQTTLPDICKNNVDACLLTILFLARYEDSIYTPLSNGQLTRIRRPSSHQHLVGATACLEHWLNCLSTVQAPSSVITHTRRNLTKAALLGQFELPNWLRDGALFGERGIELELDYVLIRLICVRGHIFNLLEDKTTSPQLPLQILSSLEALHKEAQAIDKALLDWMNSYPGNTYHVKHKLASNRRWSKNNFYHPHLYVHEDYNQAAIHVQHCGYRMLTNHLLNLTLEVMEKCPSYAASSKSLEYRRTMSCLAYDLASTIPFCLRRFTVSNEPGPFDDNITIAGYQETEPYVASLVATPLVIASTTMYIDAAYTNWFASQLANIGRLTGYGLIESVGTGSWFKL